MPATLSDFRSKMEILSLEGLESTTSVEESQAADLQRGEKRRLPMLQQRGPATVAPGLGGRGCGRYLLGLRSARGGGPTVDGGGGGV